MTTLAWIFICLGIATALAIAVDVSQRPQMMKIMNVTWPITGLYMPVIGLWFYWQWGRMPAPSEQEEHQSGHQHGSGDEHGGHGHGEGKPLWQSAFVSATHCGGGCTLGDFVAAPLAALAGVTIFGSAILGHFVWEFIAAYAFGVLFQYLPIRSMGDSSPKAALVDAVKADTLSLVSFQFGMYVWMLIATFAFLGGHMDPFTARFWFMMQIAMIVGFVTSYPVNGWLVKRGIKHAM